MNHLDGTGKRQKLFQFTAEHFTGCQSKYRTDSFAPWKKAIAHSPYYRLCLTGIEFERTFECPVDRRSSLMKVIRQLRIRHTGKSLYWEVMCTGDPPGPL